MSERISAEEFAAKTTEERDWMIYDSLGKGQDKMTGLRTDVNKNTHAIEDVGGKLDSHINDKGSHPKVRTVRSNPGNPGNPGTKSRIQEHRLKIIGGIVATITILAGYYFGGG